MSGKLAYVTGGMGGIGTSICQRLARKAFASWRVAASRNYQQWLDEQAAQGYTFHASVGNVSDWDSTVKAFEGHGRTRPGGRAGQQCGHHPRRPVPQDERGRLAHGDRHQPQQPVQRDQAGHRRHGREAVGRIINISSVNGQKGQFGQTNYSTAKAGIHSFTMALAREVASKGVTVNTISPGYIGTDMVARSAPTCWRRSSPPSRCAAWARRRKSRRSRRGWRRMNPAFDGRGLLAQRRPAHGLTHVGPPVGLAPGGFGEKAARHYTDLSKA